MTCLTNYISWVRFRWDNVGWTNDTKGYEKNKWGFKISLSEK